MNVTAGSRIGPYEVTGRVGAGGMGEVLRARDTRIGRKYLTGGMGYGGPCFPRDNKALLSVAQTLDAPADLALATDRTNGLLLERQVARVHALVPPGGTVAVLGLSYKPNTNVVEESQGLALAARLAERGARVVVYDPLALDAAHAALGNVVGYAPTITAALRDADVVVVATPADELKALTPESFPRRARPTVVLDVWRLLGPALRDCPWVTHVPFGVGPAAEPGPRRSAPVGRRA